jgi:hypothetical protein
LLLPQVTTRDTVLLDHPLVAQDVASFQQAIWQFIAVHSTDDIRLELMDYPCSVAMPPKRDDQKYQCTAVYVYVNVTTQWNTKNVHADLLRYFCMQQKVTL